MLSWLQRAAPLAAALALGCGAADVAGPPDGGSPPDDDDTGGFADADTRSDPPDASTELPERVHIVVETVKFAPTYMGMPWDGAAGSKPDPFVVIEVYDGSAGAGRTDTAPNADVADYRTRVLENVPVADVLGGIGIGVLDEDATEAESVRDSPSNPDYPDDDYVAGLGTLVFESQLDGSEQVYESNYENVGASIVVRFVPAP